MAFDDFLISPMTKIARNCQNFDKFCAIFCIFKFYRVFFYFSVFIKISPFFFIFPTMTKLTPPHTGRICRNPAVIQTAPRLARRYRSAMPRGFLLGRRRGIAANQRPQTPPARRFFHLQHPPRLRQHPNPRSDYRGRLQFRRPAGHRRAARAARPLRLLVG